MSRRRRRQYKIAHLELLETRALFSRRGALPARIGIAASPLHAQDQPALTPRPDLDVFAWG
jgi:hypothetical protein